MATINIKFDERIEDTSNIQSLIHFDEKYVGKSGYFSDVLYGFQDLNDCHQGTLLSISTDDGNSDYIFETEDGFYRFFIPEESVKEPEKKYKVFSLEKFLETFKVGDVITYREKDSTDLRHSEIHHKMLTGYIVCAGGRYDIPGIGKVTLGANTYGLVYLFNTYEIFLNGKWQPFGIEE